MTIYNNYLLPFAHFFALEATKQATKMFSDRENRVTAVALAIIFSMVAIAYCSYCIVTSDLLSDIDPNEPLQKQTADLARQIDKILQDSSLNNITKGKLEAVSFYLKNNSHKKEIVDFCKQTNQKEDYLIQSFIGSYKTLCRLFNDELFPIEKKLEILERLENERHQCIAGLVGLLSDICNSVNEPTDKAEILSWLIACYKLEVIKAMITEVHLTHNFIVYNGEKFGLPPSVIKAAKADFFADTGLQHLFDTGYVTYHELGELLDTHNTADVSFNLDVFRSSCTSQGCLEFLENFINSDLPVRAQYRAYILSWLANQVPDEKVDDADIQASILAKHKIALENEKKREKERLEKKFKDKPASEFAAEWDKTLKKIKLKENPFMDNAMYANYYYRMHIEDSEDNKLTLEAIELFAKETLEADAYIS